MSFEEGAIAPNANLSAMERLQADRWLQSRDQETKRWYFTEPSWADFVAAASCSSGHRSQHHLGSDRTTRRYQDQETVAEGTWW